MDENIPQSHQASRTRHPSQQTTQQRLALVMPQRFYVIALWDVENTDGTPREHIGPLTEYQMGQVRRTLRCHYQVIPLSGRHAPEWATASPAWEPAPLDEVAAPV